MTLEPKPAMREAYHYATDWWHPETRDTARAEFDALLAQVPDADLESDATAEEPRWPPSHPVYSALNYINRLAQCEQARRRPPQPLGEEGSF